MTTALAIHNDMDVMTLGRVLSQSGYFADARDAAQAVVKVMAGQELGFGPIASMSGIYIINGKPTISANLMAAAIKRSRKYDYRIIRLDNDGCEIAFYQGADQIGVSTFTRQDASNAGALTGKNQHTWKAYARNMLFARALSNGARWYTPDIFGGPIYTPEEMDADVDENGDVLIEVTPTMQQAPALPAPAEPVPTRKGERQGVTRLRDLVNQARAQGVTLPSLPAPRDMTDEQLYDAARDIEARIAAHKGNVIPTPAADWSEEFDAIEASEQQKAGD